MTKRAAGWLSVLALLLLLICGGGVFWYAVSQDDESTAPPKGVTRLLTIDGAGRETRLTMPAGAKISYAAFYAETDWAAAVQVTFDRAALPAFLTDNALPAPTDGLRPVPAIGGAKAAVPRPTVDPSASSGASPAASGAPGAPPAPVDVPEVFGAVLDGATTWRPERASTVSGIPRTVHSGVARWIMFDLDNPDKVTMYVYSMPEVPASATANPSASN